MIEQTYIGQGSYGCVLKPGINCYKFLSNNNTIVKLFKEKEHYYQELVNQNKLEKLFKNNLNVIVKKISNCQIRLDTYHYKIYENCKDLKYLSPDTIIYQIIYEYGGIDLMYCGTTTKKCQKIITFFNIFKNYKNILHALSILCKKGYIHHDVRNPNLLFNINNNMTKLIDFGFLADENDYLNNTQKFALVYRYPNYHYPPELNLKNFSELYYNMLNIINQYYNKSNNKKELYDIIILLKEFKAKFILILNSKTKKDIQKYNKFFKPNFKKIDSYMIGVALLQLYIYCLIDNRSGLNYNQHNIVLKFIKKNISLRVRFRYSPITAYKDYKKIIKSFR